MSDGTSPDGEAQRVEIEKVPEQQGSKPNKQRELFPALLDIERQRIDSYNRRTEVASQAVAASNESDKRQFEFQMAKLKTNEGESKRRDSLAKLLVLIVSIPAVLGIILFLVMAFFGSAAQTAVALKILETIAIGGGGYGIISGIARLVKKLMHNDRG